MARYSLFALKVPLNTNKTKQTSCRRAAAMICPAPLLPLWAPKRLAPPSRCNVVVVSHGQYVPTLTAAAARRVNTAVSKAVR